MIKHVYNTFRREWANEFGINMAPINALVVAVQELIALQGTLGNLNLLAPKEDILERLRDIKDIYNRNMNIIRDQYTPEDLARFGFDLSGKDNLEPSRLDLIAAELSRRNL